MIEFTLPGCFPAIPYHDDRAFPTVSCADHSNDWLKLAIIVKPHEVASVEACLERAGALAISLEDEGDEPCFEIRPGDGILPWRLTRVVGLFPAACDARAVLEAARRTLRRETVPPHRLTRLADQDWERAWLDRFRPMRFGRRLWICPGDQAPPDPGAINLFLDPGLAFGTGTHPTTALCLEWLDSAPLAGTTVLDYGCGSGILAIAALRLGAQRAWAVDIDAQALAATRANAERNGVADRIQAIPPEALPALAADCIVANILAGPLQALAPRLAQRAKADAALVLSGILAGQAQNVIDAYRPWYRDFEICRREEWVRVVARRSPGRD